MAVNAQLQTGENVAVTNTDAGKVRGYIPQQHLHVQGHSLCNSTTF